jgi:hypothetical protein
VIGVAAAANGTHLELAVYIRSAMMLASNFRFSTEDVDIAEITKPWPEWLSEILSFIAARNNWSEDWLNDAVECHLSPIAQKAADHIEYGSFPKEGQAGLSILVPSAEYLLALKLKAMRTTDPVKGPQETDDIYSLMRVLKNRNGRRRYTNARQIFSEFRKRRCQVAVPLETPASEPNREKQRCAHIRSLKPVAGSRTAQPGTGQ